MNEACGIKRRAIITGATGFIGCALCNELLEHDWGVTAVFRPGSRKKTRLPEGVCAAELALDRLCDLTGNYDVFYHLAWNGSGGNDRNDFDIQQPNIKYTVEAVRAAGRCGCRRFVGAGSQAEYGVVRGICTEETAPHPFMMYGAAKLAACYMGGLVARQEGVSFVWPRIYSVYGVGRNAGTLINYVIDTLKAGGVPQLSTCENMWDFLYITDCAAALRLLGENGRAEGIYNVSYGEPRQLRRFVEKVRDAVAPEGRLNFGGVQSDPERTFWLEPDIGKISKLGFKAKVGFDSGIRLIQGKTLEE
jgi:UDP-glucose 4-epimerase